jgi:hypothetical protein
MLYRDDRYFQSLVARNGTMGSRTHGPTSWWGRPHNKP